MGERIIIENFIFKDHQTLLTQYFEKNRHLCSDEQNHHRHRNLHYGDMTSETVKYILKHYLTKTCFFIEHYFKEHVAPFNAPRICCYYPGESLDKHVDKKDGFWNITYDMKYSSILYLNDNYEGGEIQFTGDQPIKMKAGSCIFFLSDATNEHQVLKVKKGNRYSVPSWYTTKIGFLKL
tara:strand:- start:108 stop:644 length:537 start_codon:yes stop_codon:yes gene_type:complete